MDNTPPRIIGKRPTRESARQIYSDCPFCGNKYIVTEIEWHVVFCQEKHTPPEEKKLLAAQEAEYRRNLQKSKKKRQAKRKQTKEVRETTVDPDIETVGDSDDIEFVHSPDALPLREKKPKVAKTSIEDTKPSHKDVIFETASCEDFNMILPGLTLRPTPQEFQDPIQYISNAHEMAKEHGIVKIIPPYEASQWLGLSSPSHLNPDKFRVETKQQDIHCLTHRGTVKEFWISLNKYRDSVNRPRLYGSPNIIGQTISLYRLYKFVNDSGGYEHVCKRNGWESITAKFGLPIADTFSVQLKDLYEKFLLDYEMYSLTNLLHSTKGEKKAKLDYDLDSSKKSTIVMGKYFNQKDEFGYGSGDNHTLTTFRQFATEFQQAWYEKHPESVHNTAQQKEKEFWNTVDGIHGPVRVLYGSDLDVRAHGSGFPPECRSPWNLQTLPTCHNSVLRHLPQQMSGITVPMMYIGMMFSTFCWHTEDNYLYSINYVHEGAPKIWYGIGSVYCDEFESAVRDAIPELFEDGCDSVFHGLVTMVSPIELVERGVPLVRIVQNPGEFVVTFPRAYHAGFNTGYNMAEAVNFAAVDWIPFGHLSTSKYSLVSRGASFASHELFYRMLQYTTSMVEVKQLIPIISYVLRSELHYRNNLVQHLLHRKTTSPPPDRSVLSSKPCTVCKLECFFSYVCCQQCGKISCLNYAHAKRICKCEFRSRILVEVVQLQEIKYYLQMATAASNGTDSKLHQNEQQAKPQQQQYQQQQRHHTLSAQPASYRPPSTSSNHPSNGTKHFVAQKTQRFMGVGEYIGQQSPIPKKRDENFSPKVMVQGGFTHYIP